MKILFISPQPFFQWRGSPIRVNLNMLALTKLDYSVDLLTLPIGEDKTFENGRVIRVANPLNIEDVPIGPSLLKIFFDILILWKGFTLCRKNKYDIIHGVEEAGMIAVVLSRLFKTRSIFEKHSDPFSYKKGFLKNCILSIYAFVERMTVKMVDAVICTGPGLVKQVEEMETGTKAFHIFDIPSSLVEAEPDKVDSLKKELQHDENEVLIAFVGSFASYQGVDLMFAAIPEVMKEETNARFVIIGGSDEEIAERKLILKKEGVEENVTFLGKIAPDILPHYLSASDILLSPRATGVNTPLKILDYMKAGRSIVATDIPSNRLLMNEKNGMLMEATPFQFARGITMLIRDEGKREAMGIENLKMYKIKYNFNEYCKRISDCYSYVLDTEKTVK